MKRNLLLATALAAMPPVLHRPATPTPEAKPPEDPIWPGLGIPAMNWSNDPPTAPGRYWWRRTWQWEPVVREIPADRLVYSHRYVQKVPVEKIGGQWGDKVEGT